MNELGKSGNFVDLSDAFSPWQRLNYFLFCFSSALLLPAYNRNEITVSASLFATISIFCLNLAFAKQTIQLLSTVE
jgi:hypothetical protein